MVQIIEKITGELNRDEDGLNIVLYIRDTSTNVLTAVVYTDAESATWNQTPTQWGDALVAEFPEINLPTTP